MFLNLINNNDKFMDALTDLKNCGSDALKFLNFSDNNELFLIHIVILYLIKGFKMILI